MTQVTIEAPEDLGSQLAGAAAAQRKSWSSWNGTSVLLLLDGSGSVPDWRH